MSSDLNWDIDKYKEEHEHEEHWQLRKSFIQRWKGDYPEERLVCLARVFANMEFMGCRYPLEVMQEVYKLSHEVAQSYRNSKKGKLQRTFVSASVAAEDRARGVKREGGVVVDSIPQKSSKINFVPQGATPENQDVIEVDKSDEKAVNEIVPDTNVSDNSKLADVKISALNEYLEELNNVKCVPINQFNEKMFYTAFGRMVLLVRPWAGKLWNIQASCQACNIQLNSTYENCCFSLTMNGKLVSRATGDTKLEAKGIVEMMVWNRLKEEVISVLVKEQWIAQGNARISAGDVAGRGDAFGTPVENSVAIKMMKMMGWKGGGLGADAQGIAEPVKPNLQMVNRSGLGSEGSDLRRLRRAGEDLMRRFAASDSFELDLVFSAEFSKEERAALHQLAQRAGLASRSYGPDHDRFLVVRKKLDPFSLVRAVIEKGGNTPKYQVFIPASLSRSNGR